MGFWDYEPEEANSDEYSPTGAMPGTTAKLDVLAERLESGLPLWHPNDRRDCEESSDKFASLDTNGRRGKTLQPNAVEV
jgi:hypothetical protein